MESGAFCRWEKGGSEELAPWMKPARAAMRANLQRFIYISVILSVGSFEVFLPSGYNGHLADKAEPLAGSTLIAADNDLVECF